MSKYTLTPLKFNETIKQHRKMGNWLTKHLKENNRIDKKHYFVTYPNDKDIICKCYCCDYTMTATIKNGETIGSHDKPNCDFYPIEGPTENRYVMRCCVNYYNTGLFDNFNNMLETNQLKETGKIAREIVNPPIREEIKELEKE